MSLWQGVKGAQAELAAIQHPLDKLRRLGSISKIFAAEILGTIALAPFAFRASSLYSSLPSLDSYEELNKQPVYVAKDIRYGPGPRNTVDMYLPVEAAAAIQQGQERQGFSQSRVPVVVFVHGGVWAAGDKWHYAPLAACLARLGVLACVVSYSLYPDALVPQMVGEVAAAFDWAVETAGRYGGDRQQISLVGHSAGAQLCMMALLQRAKAIHQSQQHSKSFESQHAVEQQQLQQLLPVMPRQFVAVTGVYDIARHYAYEQDREVHELSTMKRAMGGFQGFAAMSPAVILGAALQQQQRQQQQQQYIRSNRTDHQHHDISQQQSDAQQQVLQQQQQQVPPACGYYGSFQLCGEAISHRIGFDRGSSHYMAAECALQQQREVGMSDILEFPLPAAAHLPATVMISSCTDMTVPWYESAEMYHKLLDAGVPVKHLVYNKVGHGDFVVDWPSKLASTLNSSNDDWGQIDTNLHQQPDQQAAAGAELASLQDSNGSCSSGDYPKQSSPPTPDDADTDWAGNSHTVNSSSRNTGVETGCLMLQRYDRKQLIEELPPYCRDLAVIVTGQQPLQFVQKQVSYGDLGPAEAKARVGGVGVTDAMTASVQSVVLMPSSAAVNHDNGDLDTASGTAIHSADAEMLVQLADCELN